MPSPKREGATGLCRGRILPGLAGVDARRPEILAPREREVVALASPPPTVTCYIVEVRDFAGPLVDGDFTIVIL